MVCTACCFIVGTQGVNGMYRLLSNGWYARGVLYVLLSVQLLVSKRHMVCTAYRSIVEMQGVIDMSCLLIFHWWNARRKWCVLNTNVSLLEFKTLMQDVNDTLWLTNVALLEYTA